MECKYYSSTWFGNSYCKATGREEKITYERSKEYCANSYRCEKCPVYKDAERGSFGRFISDLFGW